MKWNNWVIAILGLWVIISAFIFNKPGGMIADLVITGIIIIVLAVWGGMSRGPMSR